MQRHALPFRVSLVTSEDELERVVALRSSAYARHAAPAADKLRVPEPDDARDDVVVLVAKSKLEDMVVGTIRLNPNSRTAMRFEASAPLPDRFAGARCVEFMRLGVASGGNGDLVSAALAKASFHVCKASDVDFIFVASRHPVDVVYKRYRFDDLLDGKKVQLDYAPGVEHSILCLPVATAEERWRKHSRSVHSFFVETEHPDIGVDYAEAAHRLRGRHQRGSEGLPRSAVRSGCKAEPIEVIGKLAYSSGLSGAERPG